MRGGLRARAVPGARVRAGVALAVLLGSLLAFPACFWSEVRRVTIDVDAVTAWAGQEDGFGAADSLIGAVVPVTDRIPELRSGDVVGVEEVALYIQIQNASFAPVEAAVYAHRARVDLATLLAEGIRLTRPILVQPQSAFLVDARNYHLYAEGFDAVSDLILGGDFYLYVASRANTFILNGNVPALSLIVSIDD